VLQQLVKRTADRALERIRSSPEDGEREVVLMRWGLIPEKTTDPDSFKTFSTTNARAETILEKPIWRGPFQHRRCLVLLDGFYEWLLRPSLPQPPPIEPGEHGLFGDIAAPARPAAKPKAGSRPVYGLLVPNPDWVRTKISGSHLPGIPGRWVTIRLTTWFQAWRSPLIYRPTRVERNSVI